MRQMIRRFLLLSIFLIGTGMALYAQANSQLTGIVTDQSGALVSDAKITLTDPDTGVTKTTVSGPTGLYTIPGLNPSNYNLKITAKGFEAYAQNGIVINVSSTVRTDVKLTVGAENQTVTVTADALAVQTDSNVVSSLVSAEQITEIATENRNFAALAAMGLGVTSTVPDSNTPTSVAASFTLSVNGLRWRHNIWLIDGGESDDRGGGGGMASMPSQDAIAEFNMLTSNYPPDYGISSGATISLSLKSGGQKYHGGLWEFNRNTDYNANSYFNKHTSEKVTPRVPTHYNIFGGNFGGPLFIPKVYNTNKQKTFFFWNEEWRKISNSNGTNVTATIPTADIPKSGTDLVYKSPAFNTTGTTLVVPNVSTTSAYYINKLQPLGLTPGAAFPSNTIPHSLFDANAVTYLNAGVLPPVTDSTTDKNTTALSLPIKVRNDVVRIDHNFNSKWAILGHYLHDSVDQGYAQPELGWLSANYNTLTSDLKNPANSAAIKLTGTINPNLLVEASINYDGNTIDITPSSNTYYPSTWSVSPVVSAYKISRKIWPSVELGAPYGTKEHTGTEPFHNAAQDYEPKVDVSYTYGKHALKFGFSYNRYTKNQMLFGESQGTYAFGTLSNDSVVDFLLGLPSSYSQMQSSPILHYVNQTPSVYAMDNWHITPRLTLQLGLRYDALPHAWERSNLVSNFNPAHYQTSDTPTFTASGAISSVSPDLYTYNGIQSYANGMDLAGQWGTPRGLVTNDYKTIQPRIGFSEDLFGNGRTVLRGGIGSFFERMQGNDIYNTAASGPFSPSLSLSNTYFSAPGTNYQTGASVTASQLIFAASGVSSMASTYKAPAVAQYSIGVQHELAPAVIWVIQYVGNVAWHQNLYRPLNNMKTGGVGLITTNGSAISTTGSGVDSRCIEGDGGGKYTGDSACTVGFTNNGGFNAYRQYPGYADIKESENNSNGSYNSFQTGLRIQNRWGLSGEIDYTWSHEIDLLPDDLSSVSNPWILKYDKGSGQLDRRQVLNINYMYKLPFFNKEHGLVHSIAGGWEISGTIQAQSGSPAPGNTQGAEFSASYDPVGLGGGYTNRPNISGKVKYVKSGVKWFDPSNFSVPTPSWAGGPNLGFGNTGKDAIVGPRRINFTTSLYKSFAIREAMHFELRFESFNTFNHTQFKYINNTLGSSDFGNATTTWDPRNLEIGGKFVF